MRGKWWQSKKGERPELTMENNTVVFTLCHESEPVRGRLLEAKTDDALPPMYAFLKKRIV